MGINEIRNGRAAERRQINPFQRNNKRGGAIGELPLLHNRAECGNGKRAGRAA